MHAFQKLKKKEPQSMPETSSGKKRIGKMPNDPVSYDMDG